MDDLVLFIVSKLNYWIYIALMMIGMYAMIVKKNLVKKIIGMNILQTAVILFFISIGAKSKATIPIIEHAEHLNGAENHAIHAVDYINPLPHVLMLTAIVVSVATLGVALALIVKLHERCNTLEEDEILAQLKED